MKENYTPLTQTPLSVSNTAVDEKINAITPNEEYVPSTGRQLLGMGIEIGGGMISELVAPFAAAGAGAVSFGAGAAPVYVGTKYSFGVASSYLAQIVEGHPEWRHGRAQFAGGANIVPFGSTVRKTKDGVGLFSKVMVGRYVKTAAKGSVISTASITGERVIDDGRLPTLGELGFAATFGAGLGAGFDIGSVKVGEKFLPVWDKMTDSMKRTFLKVAGKSPQEIREQITKGKISREEFRTLRDQLVDDAYKDAGFFDGFMGNKKIDVNSLKPSQRLDYVKNRLQYLDELNEDVIDNLEDGIIDVKEFRAQTKPINAEMQALRLREEELTKLARETPTVKPETERPVSPEEVIEEAVDEIDEPAIQTPEAEAPVPPKDTPETTPASKPIIQFKKDGVPYKIEGTYIRFGRLPKEASEIGNTGKKEIGHSVYPAYFDPKTKKYIILDIPAERGVGTQDALIAANKKVYEVSGKKVGKGSDGEPLLDVATSKQVKEINRSDVVLRDEPFQDIDLNPIGKEAGFNMEAATTNFPEGFKLADYTYKKNDDGNFQIFKDGKIVDDELRLLGRSKISSESEAKKLIEHNIDEDLIDFNIAQKDTPEPTPAPKDTPVPTPEPTEKERIIELAEQLMGRKDILDADGNKIGLTSKVAAQKTEQLVDAFKAYKTRVVDTLTQRTEGGDYDADELIKLLDDYAEIAPAKFEVDNKDGNVLRVRGEGATSDEVQEVISKRKQDELAAIYALRDAVKRDRDEPLDVDNLESLRKRIMGEADDEVAEGAAPKPRTSEEQEVIDEINTILDTSSDSLDAPLIKEGGRTPSKKTSEKITKEKEKLQKELKELEAELDKKRKRFGDDKADLSEEAKPKKTPKEKDPRIIDLKNRLGFYNRAEKVVRAYEDALEEQARLSNLLKFGKIDDIRAEVIKDEVLKGTGSPRSQLQEKLNKVSSNNAKMKQAMRDTIYPPKPKPTPQQSRIASLEKQLAREREVFTGQRDPSDPQAPVTSPRIRELEAQIKFCRTASNEAAEVAELQEKNKLLYAMVSGQDVAKIDENLGIHPKFRPDYANKKKMTGHLEFLRKQNKRLQEEARKVQKDAALAQADRVLNPDLYATSKLDRGIAKFEEITTGLLLDSPLTGTAGLVSNTVAMLTRPLRDTVGGYMWRNLPLKEKRIYRQALYRFANILAYKDIVTGFFDVSNISNMYGAAKNRGQNPMFPKARVRLDETTQKPRAKNQRAIDKARARQKRRDKGDGLNNALMRIKTAEITGDVVMELTLFGRTTLGVMDVPFANAVTKSRLYAEALRDAIRNEATDIQAHVKKYMEEAYTVQNGRKVWAYKERDLDIINEYREALLMPRDLKDGDIRKTVMERVTEAVDSQTGAGTIFGRVIQLMFPVRTTGSIATGLISNTVGAVPIAAGRFGAKGLAKLSPDSKFVSKTRAGVVAKTQNNVNRYRKIIREGVDDKGVALTEESKAQIQNQLNVEETRLAKLKTQMEEVDRKTIGNVLMFAAYFITAWNLIDEDEEEGITGSGAHFDRKQRKDSNFQPYKFIYDDGKSMVDYRMSDPDKALLAFVADVKAYHVAKKNNEIPEDSTQSLTKTIRRSAFQILTDNPYMTGARNVSTLMNAETDDDRLLRVFASLISSRFSPPSFVRHINQNDDVYVPDNLQSKPKDMTIDRMFGLEPANVRRYETGAPMYLPEKDIWNLIIRSARTRKRAMSYQEVYDILETDGRRTNIVGSLAPTHKGIKTKDYWNEDGQTLYDAFGEFIYNYMPTKPVEVGDKTYRNLRLEEVMYDIITDPSWDDKYNDGEISNVKTDGYIYAEELFDAKGNLKNVSGQSNEGLEELQRVRLAYIRAAENEFFKRDTLKNFKNSDGMTPQEQIAETANRITE